jgi:FkbM family methyltransferase
VLLLTPTSVDEQCTKDSPQECPTPQECPSVSEDPSCKPYAPAEGYPEQSVSIVATLPPWTFAHAQQPIRTLVDFSPKSDPKGSSKAQHAEDLFVYHHFFYGKGSGTFLEMGALDGVTYSNTWMFEKVLGWSGVLIEPSPPEYEKLKAARPNQLTVNSAVCDSPTMVHFIANKAVGGIYEFMEPEFVRRWHAKYAQNPGLIDELPLVLCMPLSDVLHRFGIKHIDFWSLDVEGAEHKVLETIDFDSISFDVIIVEASGDNQRRDDEMKEHVVSHGYAYYGKFSTSFVFTRNGFVPSAGPRKNEYPIS